MSFVYLLSMAFLVLAGWLLYHAVRGLALLVGLVLRLVGRLLGHGGRFVRNVVVDVVHAAGALVTAAAVVPLSAFNLLTGRFSAAGHYLRAVEDELASALLGVYRVAVHHPLRLVGLGALVDGLERRLPDLIDRAPRARARRGRSGDPDFPGYHVVSQLPEGGSGARLFLARPRPEKAAELGAAGRSVPEEVVIKSFAIGAGSTLPQIVRESRALDAAKRLGLVLEHQLGDASFHYVMPYVRGQELGAVVDRLHQNAGPLGLDARGLELVTGFAQDLLGSLDRFHSGGLWHKDIKPANLIVSGERAHLVDFGLVTPLRSAMTLTTHGTEYYRDPEMVRLALQGVKVHEVDGVKFDLYSAGAVLYTMVEGSFPAHGSLSRITKRCPEALEWIIRRAMADLHTRYSTARAMRADLAALASAKDPYALKPADLPSFRRGDAQAESEVRGAELAGAAAPAGKVHTFRTLAEVRRTEPQTPSTTEPGRFTGASPRRRRRRRAVFAAAGLMALTAVSAGRLAAHLDERAAHGMPARSYHHLEADELRTVRAAEQVADEARRANLISGMSSRWERELRPLFADARERRSTPELGNVLVLEDLDQEREQVVTALETMLREHDLAVLGRSPEPAERELSLVAGARNAIGLGDPSDAQAVLELQDWLDGSSELDAVVWLAFDELRERTVYRLLVRRDARVEPPRSF